VRTEGSIYGRRVLCQCWKGSSFEENIGETPLGWNSLFCVIFANTPIFLRRKTIVFTKMAKIKLGRFRRVLRDRITPPEMYAPLKTRECQFEPPCVDGRQPDLEVTFAWGDRGVSFVAARQARSSPRQVKEALRNLQERWTRDRGKNALPVLPHISPSVADLLEETGSSGIDLNGNYVLQTDDFVAIRLDQENRYKECIPGHEFDCMSVSPSRARSTREREPNPRENTGPRWARIPLDCFHAAST
jgi:hypothetical protein